MYHYEKLNIGVISPLQSESYTATYLCQSLLSERFLYCRMEP